MTGEGGDTIFGFGLPLNSPNPKLNPRGAFFKDNNYDNNSGSRTSDASTPKRNHVRKSNQVKKSRRLSGIAGLTSKSRSRERRLSSHGKALLNKLGYSKR